jgi:hypothetical protein
LRAGQSWKYPVLHVMRVADFIRHSPRKYCAALEIFSADTAAAAWIVPVRRHAPERLRTWFALDPRRCGETFSIAANTGEKYVSICFY